MSVRVTQKGTVLLVDAPYDATFIAGAKRLGGRWSPEQRVWGVPLGQRAQLRVLLLETYKTDAGLPDEPAPAGPRPLLPSVAEFEAVIARYTVQGAASTIGAPSGPT